jgi:hypothetical protein
MIKKLVLSCLFLLLALLVCHFYVVYIFFYLQKKRPLFSGRIFFCADYLWINTIQG